MSRINLQVKKYLTAGLIAIFPLWLTLFILWFIFKWVGGLTRPLLVPLFSTLFESYAAFFLSIVSFLLTILIIYAVGVLGAHLVTKRLLDGFERILVGIPVLRTIYIAARKLTHYLFTVRGEFQRVVLVEYPRRGLYSIGFITSDKSFVTVNGVRMVSLFIPATPNPTSGLLIAVPESDVRQLDMEIDEGLKLVVSGGMIQP
jgi:uncharacterized membrane protein